MHFECAAFNHTSQYAQECVRMRKNTLECTELWDHTSKEKYSRHMRQNAQECTRMRQNALECTGLWNHTYLHKRSGADSRPNSHVDATDMGWTGCGRAIRRAHGAPMCHYMSSKSSSDSSPSPNAYTCECKRMRVWMNAFECVRMRVRQNATCRQNAPYVGRHTNAFECNSCRMQRTVNAH